MRPIFKTADKLVLKNNQELVTQGLVYYVSSGLVAAVATTTAGEVTLHLYKQGEIIHGPAFGHQPGSSLVRIAFRAYGLARVLQLPQTQFEQTLAMSVDLQKRFNSGQQILLGLLFSRLVALSYKDVYRRLVAHLLYLADRFGSISGNAMSISASMTHRQLATSISSTRETVNKLMKQLEQKGLLTMKNKTITIKSLTGLSKELGTKA